MSSLSPDSDGLPETDSGCASKANEAAASGAQHRSEYWRSINDFQGNEEFRSWMHREFPSNADLLEGADRRDFMKVMGASFALAGIGLAACRRIPETNIVPYANRPANRIPGKPVEYASAMELGGFGMGVLVRTVDGRPIKLEGNPSHPVSLGACDAITQSAVLQVYDPDRSRLVMEGDTERDAEAFHDFVTKHFLEGHAANGGEGLAVIAEYSESPSFRRMMAKLKAAYPKMTGTNWEPVNQTNASKGISTALGGTDRSSYQAHPKLDAANVIVCLDADPLMTHPAASRLAREWATNRRVDAADPSKQKLSRMYSIEGVLSVTGMAADDRIALPSSRILGIAAGIARAIGIKGDTVAAHADGVSLDGHDKNVLAAMLEDLKSNKGTSVVLVGDRQPPEVHALAAMINDRLGNNGKTIDYTSTEWEDAFKGMDRITKKMASGQIKTLLIIGGNPVYDAPVNNEFAAALGKVDTSIHLSLYRNETSRGCTWHLPRAHWLEAWGDVAAYGGTKSITQPSIMPMIGEDQRGWSPIELIAELTGAQPQDGYSIVRATEMERSKASGATFERHWREVLDKGLVADTASKAERVKVDAQAVLGAMNAPVSGEKSLELVLDQDPYVYDGRFANLGWLQELPNPITKITWDNAACMSPALMKSQGLDLGDMVQLTIGEYSLKAAAFPVPGMDEHTISLALGWGRGPDAGQIADGAGFNAYVVRTSSAPDIITEVQIANTGEQYEFAHTQDHGAADAIVPNIPLGNASGGVQGRLPTIVRETTLKDYHHHPDFAKHAVHVAHRLSLWEETNLDGARFRWGMSVDLNTCTGCGACVAACQAENNIPIVGKDQVVRGREMHWLRIDRYFKGENPAKPDAVFVQPVTCMQCENAPCEQVCPVAATLHDKDGLNVMVYNRCIGTRYCSNNCPYKVRRFNWFDYWRRDPIRKQEGILAVKPDYYVSGGPDEWRRMQLNPEVTVRVRGVMEKCTFCVQRISEAKITHKNQWAREGGTAFSPDWSIPDGAIQTACQQACATGAIVFGDLADTSSQVHRLQKLGTSYGLLEELNTKPRLKYLAKVRNPGIAAEKNGKESSDHAAASVSVNRGVQS